MRRYYLSRVVGTGTFTDKLRATAQDLLEGVAGVTIHVAIRPGSVAGDWCIVNVDAPDHAVLVADAGHKPFPDLTLDAQLNTLTTTVRNRLLSDLQAIGISTTGITTTTAFRVAVRRAGQFFKAEFDENGFG